MTRKLKIDFHIHTSEDPKDRHIPYSAKQLLDRAAECHFDAITIANHTTVLYNNDLHEYAEERGILLIPGVEASIEKKHVLIVNCRQLSQGPLNFENLRSVVGEDALIIAPHPFYPRPCCLGKTLEKHIAVFDAVEYASWHFRFLDFNKKAVTLAKRYNLPLVGTSDAHALRQLGTTYSLVEAEKTIPAIVEAVRKNRIDVVTHPLSFWQFLREGSKFVFFSTGKLFQKTRQMFTHSSESPE